MMDAIHDGWSLASSNKEGCSSILFEKGNYIYYAGWDGGGELRKVCSASDEFLDFLVSQAYLHELHHCVEGYLGSLGLKSIGQEDWGAASQFFEQALDLGFHLSHTGKALLFAAQQKIEQGRNVMNTISSLVQLKPWLYRYNGFCYQFLERAMFNYKTQYQLDLVRYWTLLLYLDANHIEALVWRGWNYQLLGEKEKALQDYQQVLPLLTDAHQQDRNRVQDFMERL